ncbi:MAG: lysophospholipid acyltransferase family protein [Puniceicoccaceae bacterium]
MRADRYHPAYRIARYLSRWFLASFSGFEVRGAENIPEGKAFILASNHSSFIDPPALGSALPRPVYFFARKTLLVGPFKWLLPRINTIPVDRDGESDVVALKKVFRVLAAGEGVVFFPEGTRSPDGKLQGAKKGLGMIACRAGAVIVPARIFGAFETLGRQDRFPRHGFRVTVVFGRPFYASEIDPGVGGSDRYQIVSDRILEAVGRIERPTPLVV